MENMICVYIYLVIHKILIVLKALILNSFYLIKQCSVHMHDITSFNEDANVNCEQDISSFHLRLTPPTVLSISSNSVC